MLEPVKAEVYHILVQHKYEAEDIIPRIKSLEDFKKLAVTRSLCSSRSQGGFLGQPRENQLDEDFAEALRKLPENQLSPIVRTRFGYHLIWKTRKIEPTSL